VSNGGTGERGMMWQWAMVCVYVFVCVERPQKIRSDLKKGKCVLEHSLSRVINR
jgi:hypothetical protein